jgi:hypothetical protein
MVLLRHSGVGFICEGITTRKLKKPRRREPSEEPPTSLSFFVHQLHHIHTAWWRLPLMYSNTGREERRERQRVEESGTTH